jgi:NTE family protein
MPFLTITPPQRATLARLADDVFAHPQRRRRDILPALRNAELRLLGRALGGDGPRRGDLFSYLYFDPQFIGASIELGRQHALAVFDGLPAAQIPWHTDLRQHVTSR